MHDKIDLPKWLKDRHKSSTIIFVCDHAISRSGNELWVDQEVLKWLEDHELPRICYWWHNEAMFVFPENVSKDGVMLFKLTWGGKTISL